MQDLAAIEDTIKDNVAAAIAEDVGSGDITACLVDAQQQARAIVITREAGVFCGRPWAEEACRQIDSAITMQWLVDEGSRVEADQQLLTLEGPTRSLLTVERTVLNFLQLLSGTATATNRYLQLIEGTDCKLLDTRKTIPGLRVAQKYAVRSAGGSNHRMGLFDAFLIKENHLNAAGSIANAVKQAQAILPGKPVEVEVETLDQLAAAIAAGAEIALIDNFDLALTVQAVELAAGNIKLEASGGVNENTITDIARTGVDYVSVGNLTKEVKPLDLSMQLQSEICQNDG